MVHRRVAQAVEGRDWLVEVLDPPIGAAGERPV